MTIKTKSRISTDYILLGHTKTTPSDDVDLVTLDRQHRQRGFLRFRYHYLINRDGGLETGRPHDTIGAGARYYNDNSIFVVLAGGIGLDGESEDNFTTDQHNTLSALLDLLQDQYPSATIRNMREMNIKGYEDA